MPARFAPFVAGFLLASVAARAQVTIPQPVLATVTPPAAQVGSSVEITITGSNLEGASALLFSERGISCAPPVSLCILSK